MHTPATFEVRVRDRQLLAADVVELRFTHPDDGPLPAWTPGSHIDVHVTDKIVRQYSLCGSPSQKDEWTIAVLREPESRGGSLGLHDQVKVGDHLTVSEPRNHFELVDAPAYLFVAGGIGITPIIPMIEQAAHEKKAWQLLYGGRTSTSMAYQDMLRSQGDVVAVRPQDEFGLLDLKSAIAAVPPGTQIYCCGPGPLLDAIEAEVGRSGRPATDLHVERFSAPTTDSEFTNHSFEVYCAKSDITLNVGVSENILDLAEKAGLEVATSCREGTCGSCETVVIEGEVDHRDWILTEQERAEAGVMMVCVSRCRGRRLVLDL